MKVARIIAIYGINNLGKSTQVSILVEKLKVWGRVCQIKYPLYDLVPTGPIIFGYLRSSNIFNLTPTEAQLIYIQNRLHFQPELLRLQKEFDFIVLEDYVGTGLAWGIGAGVSKELLLRLNSCLLTEDLAICFDGQRFLEAKEHGHKHEEDDALTARVRLAHQQLAKQFGWQMVNTNQSIEQVGEQIFQIVAEKFNLKKERSRR